MPTALERAEGIEAVTDSLSVLFWMDDGGDGLPGGHVTQFRQTARALMGDGVKVTTSTDVDPDLTGVDIVHGFNLSHERIRRLRTLGIACAISPVYWPLSFRSGSQGPPPNSRARLGRLSLAARLTSSALRGDYQLRAISLVASTLDLAYAFEAADVLLPNSYMELEAIQADLRVSTPARVVPNAADAAIFAPPKVASPRSGIVMAARIEPLKNQLRLIQACQRLDSTLFIVGTPHPHHPEYYAMCRRQARGTGVEFLGQLTQNELAQVLQVAKVHVLPSWFETTGLASLEGGLAGCSVVTTNRGYAVEYFGSDVEYCDPASVRSIADALKRALSRQPSIALSRRIASDFNWQATARETLRGYETALAGRR